MGCASAAAILPRRTRHRSVRRIRSGRRCVRVQFSTALLCLLLLCPCVVVLPDCGHDQSASASGASTTTTIRRKPVQSSALRSVGYQDNKGVLEVEFVNGAVYRYYGVPVSTYHGLMSAASHGRYFNQYIKRAGYRYVRVR
jgi:hypothetical protein